MNRGLQYFNLLGVLALGILCGVQWQHDRRLNLETIRLEQTRQAQAAKIFEQEKIVSGQSSDLELLKQQFKTEHDDLQAAQKKLRDTEGTLLTVTSERDQLKDSITNWVKAVGDRDALVKEANARILDLSTDLNSSIRKYNELTTNYNSVVQQLNDARAKPSAGNNQ